MQLDYCLKMIIEIINQFNEENWEISQSASYCAETWSHEVTVNDLSNSILFYKIGVNIIDLSYNILLCRIGVNIIDLSYSILCKTGVNIIITSLSGYFISLS